MLRSLSFFTAASCLCASIAAGADSRLAELQDLARSYLNAKSKAERARAKQGIVNHPGATIERVTEALRTCRRYAPAQPGLAVHELKGKTGKRLTTYTALVPKGYDPARRWPLILALAGGRGDGAQYARFWKRTLKGQTYLVICPTARDLWWHSSHALARLALRDACQRYHVDRNRVSITGISNGGSGTWFMAMHYPDLFAAAAPMAGAPQTGKGRVDYPYLLNLLHLPVYAVHGDADETIRIKWDRRAAELLDQQGYDCTLDVIPGGSHGSPHQRVQQVVEWLGTKVRDPNPARVRFLKQALGATTCYWLLLGRTSRPASVDVQIEGRRSIMIRSSRIGRLTLFLSSSLIDLDHTIAITHNGAALGSFTPKPSLDVLLASARIFRDPERLYPVMLSVGPAK